MSSCQLSVYSCQVLARQVSRLTPAFRVRGSGFRVQKMKGTGPYTEDIAKPGAVEAAYSSFVHKRKPIPCRSLLSLVLVVFLAIIGARPVRAEGVLAPEITAVRVGIGDRCKVGLWAPVEITLSGGSETLSGTLTVTVPDGDGIPSRVLTPPNRPCQVLPGRQTSVLLYVRIGQVMGALSVEYIVEGRVVARKVMEPSLEADRDHFRYPLGAEPLVVSVGSAALGIEDIPRFKEMDAERRPVVTRIEDVGQLPTAWYGYEGVSAVVISTSQAELYRKLMPDGARLEALDQWVRMGGRLVLCVGSRADEVLAEGAALRRFAPGRLDKIVTLKQTGALEVYSGSSSAVPQEQGGGRAGIQAAKLAEVEGVVEAREADLPLVIRTARGMGQIVFLAADADQGPLGKWSDRPLLVAKMLDLGGTRGEQQAQASAALMHTRYNDLSGQLRSALDEFSGVRTIPFSAVALMIIVYILLIGPGDYFFLRKVVRRMQWTWLSFPIIVVAVSGAAYALAYWLKGDQLRVNQADVVDVDTASGFVRGASWLNIFSPRMEAFNLSIEPQMPDGRADASAQFWFAWLGLPGGALGGMNPRGANPTLWPEHYNFAPDLRGLLGVPIQVWSTKSFTGRWSGSTTTFPQAELADEDQSLSGSLSNTLDFPLRNCVLAYDRWAYELGDLAPGQAAVLDQNSKRSELKTLLTGKKAIFGEKYSQEITPYEPENTDIAYILRYMMFYSAIDGESYTKMDNAYQSFMDLSDLLRTGRAILTAEGPSQPLAKYQGAALLRNDKPLAGPEDRHVTLYRFIFPVKHEAPAGGGGSR